MNWSTSNTSDSCSSEIMDSTLDILESCLNDEDGGSEYGAQGGPSALRRCGCAGSAMPDGGVVLKTREEREASERELR